MRMINGRILAAMFVLASITGVATAQTNSIAGRVVDGQGAGVPGATVAANQASGNFTANVVADASGAFTLKGLPRGRIVLAASARFFGGTSMEVDVPASGEITITLAPAPVAAEVSVMAASLAGTPESLSEVPGSIDRLEPRILENSRVHDVSEALRKIPGVNVRDEEGFGLRPNIGIRGTNPTRSTKVLLLEDGIPLTYAPYGDNASYYHPPVERYQSIEVMKGSSQIAYGPQTIAGVVNYLTPSPTDKPSFSIRLAGGNRSFFDGTATGSGTVGKTGLFGSFTRKQGDGARQFVHAGINDLSTKVVQTLNDRNALAFKVSYYNERSNNTYSGLTEAEYSADPRGNAFKNDFFYGDRVGVSASHSAVLTPRMTLTTNAYVNYFARDWWRQSSNSGQRPNRLSVDADCRSMADLNTTCGNEGRLRRYNTNGVEQRFGYSYDIGGAVRGELQAGGRLHWEQQSRRQENGDLPSSRSGTPVEINIRRNFASSAYIQNRFVIGDLAITPGIRVEHIEVQRRNLLTTPISEGRTKVGAVIPGIGVTYAGLPRTTLFAGVHRGFSPPRAEDIIGNNGGVVELDAEESWNYEAGVRSAPLSGLRLEATAFRLDYENQIVPASLAGGAGAVLTNGGATMQQGIEFAGQLDSAQILGSTHNLYLRTAITWLQEAEFRGLRYSALNPAVLITGKRLPYVPELTSTTSVGYSHPKGLDAFVENVYVARQFGDDLNSINSIPNGQRGLIPAQNYWNATVNYNVESWRTTFYVTAKNILDRTFIIDRTRGILPSMPRLISAGVHFKF
jgi:Fe(3+) dicitrate transport protein